MIINTKNNTTIVGIHDPNNIYKTYTITEHEDGTYHCKGIDINNTYNDINDCFYDLIRIEENSTELAIEKFFEEYNSY